MADSEHPAPLTAVCSGSSLFSQTNRISHQSLIQTEKSQPKGKRIMLETRFTEFPALSIDLGLGVLSLHLRPISDYFSHL